MRNFDPITGAFLNGTWFELDSNLVNFPCLENIKVAGCKEPMTEDLQKVLKKVGMDKPQAPMRFPTKYTWGCLYLYSCKLLSTSTGWGRSLVSSDVEPWRFWQMSWQIVCRCLAWSNCSWVHLCCKEQDCSKRFWFGTHFLTESQWGYYTDPFRSVQILW